MFDYSTNIYFSRCMHGRVTTVITCGRHFIEGEVWDDIQERLVYLECGDYITEAEVHAGWGQFPLPKQEKPHGND